MNLHDVLNPWHNPITYAIPFFVLSIVIELAALKWLDHDNVTGYDPKDARVSIFMGLASLITTIAVKVISFFALIALYTYVAPWHLPMNHWWSWVIVILAVDFLFYWQHRFLHRVRIGWAAHQAHHNSEFMNFATALRQKWNPWFDFVFWLPLGFLGVPPYAVFAAFSINLIYQFFTHTESIERLSKPIEFIFNTPSHHRVHHGSDEIYLDKNYAGILIIWDRMFGTFQPEIFRPKYGLTSPMGTYNVFELQYGHYRDLWTDMKNARDWREGFSYIKNPPGWSPAELSGGAASAETVPAPTR